MNSMTGFGRATQTIQGIDITVEVKSVNHRYLDTRFRLPSVLNSLELPFTQNIRQQFARGSFDVTLRYRPSTEADETVLGTRFVADTLAIESFLEASQKVAKQYNLIPPNSIETLVAVGKMFTPIDSNDQWASLEKEIVGVFNKALDDLESTRAREGKKLYEILQAGVKDLLTLARAISEQTTAQTEKIKERVESKIKEWSLPTAVDAQRLEWEVAFLADRADFTEEMDRFVILSKEFTQKLDHNKDVGRRLDFLTQEMHRELNTMGSKASMVEITQMVVDAKSQLEKLRQQVQNVE